MKNIKNNLILSMAAAVAMTALTGCGSESSTPQEQQAEWYVSTRVSVSDPVSSATYEGTNPAVFGKLAESSDGFDKNDVSTFDSVSTRKAAVVFVQNDWDENSGEYHSNYHDTKVGEKDSWGMTVFSSVPDAEVTLKWDGLYELRVKNDQPGWDEKKVLDSSTLEELELVDTVTGEVTPAVTNGKLNTYSFTMESDESSRTFVWKQGSSTETISAAALSSTKTYIMVKQKEEKEKAEKAAKADKAAKAQGNKFGLPPM